MKRWILLLCALIICVNVAGCSGKPYNFDLTEYVKSGEYKGIEVSAAALESEIQYEINTMLGDHTIENEITDRPVKTGDIVNINFVGKLDGEPFEGGSADNYDIEIGSGTFIEGFEDSIIGTSIGDVINAELKFPDDYELNEELSGADVLFEITVNSIKEVILPEFNDEFIKENYDYESVQEFKDARRVVLRKNFVWNTLLDNSEIISYPKKNISDYYNQMIKYYESYATMSGYTLESFLAASTGETMEDFLAGVVEYAKNQVKQELVMYTVARAENIEISDDEYKSSAPEYAEKYGYESVKEMEKAYTKNTVKQNMLMDKTIDYVVGLSVDTE